MGGAAPGSFGLGGAAEPTDKFITDRIPALAKYKMFVVGAVFVLAYCKGWVGPWGMVFGFQSKSYFDLLGIPMRCVADSPWYGTPFIYCQLYADLMVRAPGLIQKAPSFIRRVADGSFQREMQENMDEFQRSAREQANQPKQSFAERLQEYAQQAQQAQQRQQRSTQPTSQVATNGQWQPALDPSTGVTYYWNTVTRETRWEMPAPTSTPTRPPGDVIDV